MRPAAVDVCIATYKRPGMLDGLLQALADGATAALPVRLIVVDNDCHGSARATVDAFRQRSGMAVLYAVEPVQNIALARNRALALAGADYVAFIDDDELPAPDWLATLLACRRQFGADIVFGPVDSRIPPGTPAWLAACFRHARAATGTHVPFGGAGNVLLRRSVLVASAARFDPAFGRTGGEDTDFFFRLHRAGYTLVWCNEARASEAVPAARLQLGWLRRRAFRSGQTYHRIVVRRYRWRRKVAWLLLKSAQLVAGSLAAPLLYGLSYATYIGVTLRLAGALGQLSLCFSRRNLEEYRD